MNASLRSLDSSKGRGSKIAELKKFFDSRADQTGSTGATCANQCSDVNDVCETDQFPVVGDNKITEKTEDKQSSVFSELSTQFVIGESYLRYGSHNCVASVSDDNFSEKSVLSCSDNGTESVKDEDSFNNYKNFNRKYATKCSTGLWKDVEIGLNCENALWDAKQLNDNSNGNVTFKYSKDGSFGKNTNQNSDDTSLISQNCLSASTAELNDLIAASRAESLKNETDICLEKSTLENYFTYAFENSKPQRKLPPNHMYCSSKHIVNNVMENTCLNSSHTTSKRIDMFHVPGNEFSNYECDMDEMMFDDLDDVTFSDVSSEEELKCRPSPPSHIHTQSYSLHTIIEESCEESERDSNSATPTNHDPASKLEKYFSWDIVNNLHNGGLHRDVDDNSTVYSDSLSEISGSSNDDNKDIEPAHLSSSRLETYFTTGLVGNENYCYPDDAEFLDDASEQCSDFGEDEKCHKISRSALLSSLELSSAPCFETFNTNCKFDVSDCDTNVTADLKSQTEGNEDCVNFSEDCDTKDGESTSDLAENTSTCDYVKRNLYTVSENSIDLLDGNEEMADIKCDINKQENSDIVNKTSDVNMENILLKQDSLHTNDKVSKESPKHIFSKIISQLTEISETNEFQSQSNCGFSLQFLESEIEQLLKNAPVSMSNNGNTFGSSNSDYGSDTVDSGECLTTDEDDNCVDSKVKKDSSKLKYDKLIDSENMEFWKKILQSLVNGDLHQLLHANPDNFGHGQSYTQDQVIAFMSSISNVQDKLILNKNLNSCDTANVKSSEETLQSPNDLQSSGVIIDEGISVDSTENLYSDCETVSSICAGEENLSKKVEEWYSSRSSAMGVENNESLLQETVFYKQNETMPEFQTDTSEYDFTKSADSEIPDEFKSADTLSEPHQSLDDSSSHFSVYVDIKIGDEATIVTERHKESTPVFNSTTENTTKNSSLQVWTLDNDIGLLADEKPTFNEMSNNDEKTVSLPVMSSKCFSEPNLIDTDGGSEHNKISEFLEKTCIVPRDTGYYSFKSSDDSILCVSESAGVCSESCTKSDFEESHPNSIRSSVHSNTSSKILSCSTTNLSLSSNSELKFNTLQPKPRAVKVSMNPRTHKMDYRPPASFFSPVSVLKKLLPSRINNSSSSEISYPSKYLKKYARSPSVDDDSIFGATSMPHLNLANSATAHSVVGAADCEQESSFTDDELDHRHPHTRNTQSVLSLGAHSASTTSVYSAAGGRHYGYVTVSGDVLFGLNYNQKSQTMEVFVKQCRNLAAIDIRKNKSDPYVKVYLLPDKTKSGKRKTKTKRNTLSPVFNELLRFPVLKHELEARTLWLSVWNSDLFGRNDFLGEITLALGYRLLDSPTLRWYPLQERAESLTSPLMYKGELYLALKYVPRDLSLEPRFRPAPVIAVRGALHVLVKEARNITATGSNGSSDAFCKSYLLPDKSKGSKQKTPVIRRSRHPKWYYTMIYEDLSVDELRERSLELTVWDHDKITSNDFLGAVRLNTGTGLYHGVPVEWMDSARDEASLWLAVLDRPNMWVDGCLPLRPTMQSIRC